MKIIFTELDHVTIYTVSFKFELNLFLKIVYTGGQYRLIWCIWTFFLTDLFPFISFKNTFWNVSSTVKIQKRLPVIEKWNFCDFLLNCVLWKTISLKFFPGRWKLLVLLNAFLFKKQSTFKTLPSSFEKWWKTSTINIFKWKE